jgi:molybdopterin synthase catalytic subunit
MGPGGALGVRAPAGRDWIEISAEPLDEIAATAWATRDTTGAVVTFCGTVRESSTTGNTIIALEYETSEHLATARIRDIVELARQRWGEIEAVVVHHRVGRVELGEPAVVVAVSSPHRGEAFAACQFCIDALKTTVPMWKREIWDGGSCWSQEATPIADLPRQ